ncbi:MAG: sodium:alanine symporter family protein, partial [Clostridium sp.]|nr:sodium:alanine symporter family protein [Clostridium sp.]
MDALNSLVVSVDDQVWNILLFLLVGTGLYFSIRTGFVQIRKFGSAWKRVFGSFSMNGAAAGKDGMSSFQALATAIAAQVGTGNIAGCATALVSGGPGAIFWMWIAAFFGMATIYGEAVLAQKTRVRDEHGHITGGPVYYIRKAFPNGFGTFLAHFFSIAIILALGFMGNMVQSNSISDAFHTAFGAPKIAVGVVVALIAGFIFLGGISRIAAFTEK